jgi:hypothetical protein
MPIYCPFISEEEQREREREIDGWMIKSIQDEVIKKKKR